MHENTLENALDWKAQVDEYVTDRHGGSIPMILAVNKFDLIKDFEENGNKIEEYMKEEYLGITCTLLFKLF